MGREPEKAGRVIKHKASLTWRAGKRLRRWMEAFYTPTQSSWGPEADVSVRGIPCLQEWVALRSHGSRLWVA